MESILNLYFFLHFYNFICDIIQVDDLEFVTAADCKLANVLLGLSGHGGKYSCIYCEAPKGLKSGKTWTYGRVLECAEQYKWSGSNPKRMQELANVINVALIKMDHDQEILDVLPPPELHLLMGGTNKKLELLRQYLGTKNLEQELWDWCDKHGITRRGEDFWVLSM